MADDKKPEHKVEEKKHEVKHEEPKKAEAPKADKCVAVKGMKSCPKCGWHRGNPEPHIAS